VALWWNSALEDPYISYRYAEHLAQGEGLTWNPGEPPIEGYTNFLWVAIMALPAMLGLKMVVAGKILGTILFLTLLIVLYREGLRLGLRPAMSALAVSPMVLVPAWAYYAASGLETLLFTLWTGLALIAHQREMEGRSRGPWSAGFALLATLVRPEGLGVWGLLLFLRVGFGGRAELGRQWRWALAYLAPFFAYLAWKLYYFGGVIPLPFFAKHTGDQLYQTYYGLRYIALFLSGFAGPILLLVLLLRQFSRASADSARETGGGYRHLLLFSLAYPLYLLVVGGDVAAAFPSFRLLLPLGPALVLLLMHTLRDFEPMPLARRSLLILALLTAALGIVQAEELYVFTKRINSYNGLATRLLRVPGEPPTAAFLREDARRRGLDDPVIAVLAAGQIPYYTGFRALDRLGLNDSRVAHLPKRQRGMDTKFDTTVLLESRPHYIQTNIPADEVRAGSVRRPWRLADRELWASEEFRNNYTLLEGLEEGRAFFIRKDLLASP